MEENKRRAELAVTRELWAVRVAREDVSAEMGSEPSDPWVRRSCLPEAQREPPAPGSLGGRVGWVTLQPRSDITLAAGVGTGSGQFRQEGMWLRSGR